MVVKKSMKFVNIYNSNVNDGIYGDDDGKGIGRSNVGFVWGIVWYYYYFGCWGCNGGSNGYFLLFVEYLFFSNVVVVGNGGLRYFFNFLSFCYVNVCNYLVVNGKRLIYLLVGYDFDDNIIGVDDEIIFLV